MGHHAPFPDARARDLFAEALERPQGEVTAFLARACGDDATLRQQVDQLLLAHADAAGRLVESADQVGEQPSDRIGRYKLLQKIGEGGFGTVWMAEQEEPVRRKVALKVLKAGMDTAQVVGRFEAERQALALMDHPNIAKVFDAGATPHGRPYFVMELVRGLPITHYCDAAALAPGERLALFVQVCRAVQHAHQKGLIHRDLKPSNVLVTLHDGAPVPKVIDFGIAKATSAALTERTVFTEFRQMLGTPEYMAPEQAELSSLDVDTRADIYSLGVLLYELLTGTRPFELEDLLQAGYAEMLRTIKEVDPPKPSTRVSTLGQQAVVVAKQRRLQPRALSALMRGDLDWIVMKSLEKERGRRYESASALAEDVQRHIRHEPVLAGPPSRAYRLRKYLRRNRLAVVAAAAVATSLVTGAVASGLGYFAATEQAELARIAADVAKQERTAALAARAEETRQKEAALAAQAAAQAQEAAALAAKAMADEQRQLADKHAKESRTEAAKAKRVIELLEKMLASSNPYENKDKDYKVRQLLDDFAKGLADKLEADPDVELALCRVMGRSYLALGLPAAAEPHLVRAAALTQSIHGEASLDLAQREVEVASCQREAGRFEDALTLLRAVGARLTGESSAVQAARATCLTETASVLSDRRQPGDLEQAERLIQQAIDIRRELPNEDLAASLCNLGSILRLQGRMADAQSVAEEVLALDIERHGEDSLQVATDKCNLGVLIEERGGDLARAETLQEQALEVRRRRLGEHLSVAQSLNNLAKLRHGRGDLLGALAAFTEARDLNRRFLGEHVRVAMIQQSMAMTLQGLARLDEAKTLQEEVVAMRRRLHGGDHADLANALACLGDVLGPRNDRAAAAAAYDEALAMFRRLGAESSPGYAFALQFAAGNLLQDRRPAEAERLASEAVDRLRRLPEIPPDCLVNALRDLGLARLDQGKLTEAEAPLRESLERSRDQRGSPLDTAAALESLGEWHEATQDLEGAEALFQQSVELWLALSAKQPTRPLQDMLRGKASQSQQCLARVLAKQGKLTEAAESYRRLRRVHQRLGNLQAVLATCSALAAVLRQMHEHGEAEAVSREALAVAEEVHGAKHANVAAAINNLGETLSSAGNLAEAESLYRRGLDMLRDLDLSQSVAAATQLTNLGRVLMAQDRLEEAETTCRRALAVFAQAGAADHVHHSTCLDHLAGIAARRGDSAASLALMRQSLALRRGHLGKDHVEIASRLAEIATLLLGDGKYADAEPPARECLAIRQAKLAGSWQHWSAQSLVGRALAGQGRFADAEPLLVEACTNMEPPPGSDANLRAALQALIALYEAQHKTDAAAAWEKKLTGLAEPTPARGHGR